MQASKGNCAPSNRNGAPSAGKLKRQLRVAFFSDKDDKRLLTLSKKSGYGGLVQSTAEKIVAMPLLNKTQQKQTPKRSRATASFFFV